jgi:hypothetical protein
MSVNPDYPDIIQFVFENTDKMPEGFYIQIMDLLKKIYLKENVIEKINELLEQNKKEIHKDVLRVLTRVFKKKKVYNFYNFYNFYNCMYQYFCFRYQCIFNCIVVILFFVFGFGIIWVIVYRR